MPLRRLLYCGLFIASLLICLAPGTKAQDNLTGTYVCAEMHVSGHATRCVSPPLTLYPDGSYHIWGEEGTYRIHGRWLVLSESRKRGRGRLEPGLKIEFEFTAHGKKHRVIFRRKSAVPPGTAII